MSNWGGEGNGFNIFKWRRPKDTYLAVGLLNDSPPEIQLSDYGRIPSPGSESPSELLNGETIDVEPIADLDLFFERLYSYYCEKGLWCIIVKWIVELLSLAFTICFSGFFLLYVDWDGLRNAKCGIDAVESGSKPCDLVKEALHEHPLTPLTLPKVIILGYLGLFSVYWIFCFLRFFSQRKEILRMRHFFYHSLHVTDCELKTMPWAIILEKVVRVQTTHQLCVVKDLTAQEIIMRLMRKENYLIGMINKGILAFPISKWIPGAGPTVKSSPYRGRQHLILTKTLEWTLNWSILQSMFDRNFCVRRDFTSNPEMLKKRLVIVGLAMLLLSPFLVIFMLVYLFLRHAEQFYNHPTTASSRRWSNLSRWMFREFNEVEHFFRHRINTSIVHASDYLKQFPTPIVSIVAKFISFISGGFAAVLIIIAFLDESLLEGHLFGRNLFWYAAVFGTITAISRAAITDELLVLDAEGAMSLVVQHSHYMPKRWRGKENTEMVRMEFETLFQYTAMMWLEEMTSIFLTPYLLIAVVPQRVDDIMQFIADFTVNIEGVGDVCSFSTFDFQRHGNVNYASPHNAVRTQRSSQGKMEKSFLSFQSNYPSWQPNDKGMQFLTILRTFRDQKVRTNSPPRTWQQSPLLRERNGRNSYLRREEPAPGYHLGSLWLIETEPKSHPYLIDWFYSSGPHQTPENVIDCPTVTVDIDNEGSKEIWNRPFSNQVGPTEDWADSFGNRSISQLGASTSSQYFREESVLRDNNSSTVIPPTRSHWWARGGPGGGVHQEASFIEPPEFRHFAGAQQASFLKASEFKHGAGSEQAGFLEPSELKHRAGSQHASFLEQSEFKHSGGSQQASFLEPPEFEHRGGPHPTASFMDPPEFNRHYTERDCSDSHSDRSVDEYEQERQFDWRNYHDLAQTTYPDDIGASSEGFKLLFDDVYKPSGQHAMNSSNSEDLVE
ncbi:autophagy-related protein 9 [Silene latifolia]|uniref:autophagy-related protein 9 n=1 Tax=Silene latifolia TaxID=37657 RepID=UPI003D77443B